MIKLGDTLGEALERKLYVTRIKTLKNHIVTITNGTIHIDSVSMVASN